MRDINKILESRMKTIQARTSKLHAQLDSAIRSECSSVSVAAVPKQRRRIVRSTVECNGADTGIDMGIIGMAYRALLGDPTARCSGNTVTPAHIRVWLDDEYCTTVSEIDIEAAMKMYRKSAGALVG